MPNFLVRLRENRRPVGFFAVCDTAELAFWAEQKFSSLERCEYAEISDGASFWASTPSADHEPGGSEVWGMALFADDLRFRPFVDCTS